MVPITIYVRYSFLERPTPTSHAMQATHSSPKITVFTLKIQTIRTTYDNIK